MFFISKYSLLVAILTIIVRVNIYAIFPFHMEEFPEAIHIDYVMEYASLDNMGAGFELRIIDYDENSEAIAYFYKCYKKNNPILYKKWLSLLNRAQEYGIKNDFFSLDEVDRSVDSTYRIISFYGVKIQTEPISDNQYLITALGLRKRFMIFKYDGVNYQGRVTWDDINEP